MRSTVMRRLGAFGLALLVIPLLLLVASVAGCAASPTQQWAEARITLNTAQDALVDLHAAGVITDKDLVATEPIVKPARAALDAAEARLPDGGPTFEGLLQVALAAVTKLKELEAERIADATREVERPPPALAP